jgi:hypothetical protein
MAMPGARVELPDGLLIRKKLRKVVMKQIILLSAFSLTFLFSGNAFVNVSSQKALDKVLANNKNVVVGFFAKDHSISDFMAKVAKDAEAGAKQKLKVDVAFVRMNFGSQKKIAKKYNVDTAASHIFLKNGKVVGSTGTVALSEFMKRIGKAFKK